MTELASAPPAATSSASGVQTSGADIQQQMTSNLRASGFTNVRVTPNSFVVQAKDKSGNPVTMFVTPNSMAEVTTVGAGSQTSEPEATGMFANVPARDELSSKVVGLDVYNDSNQDIGTIKDVAFNGGRINGYILSVGGFLGLGDHYVAVRPSAIKINYDNGSKKWRATMNADADQVKAAPEYKYPGRS